MKQIDDFTKNYDKISQKVNEHQIIIDSITNLFDLLYNIKNYGIDKVEISIIQSNWSQTEEEVQELAAFILQVAKSNLYLQNEMAELIIRLNNESHETNKLNILMPFIVQNIKIFYMPPTNQSYLEQNFDGCYFGSVSSKYTRDEFNDIENKFIFSFIRILYKHGIITKNEIKEALKNYDYRNRYFNAFFLPEIIELKPNDIDKLFDKNVMMQTTVQEDYKKFINFVEPYLPDKINVYQKMIDNLEPDDELTKSLIHDDVDTLQSIIITNKINIPKSVVPYNILDDLDDTPTLINYSAFCGSIKCFKYLLLNEGQIDENTFYFAVYGKNNEIIKIVDQKSINAKKPNYYMHKNNNRNINYYNDYSYIKKCNYCSDEDIISSTIKMHQNDLFDWIFESRFMRNNKIENNLNNIAKIAALNGNAHALIEIIDKGFDLSLNDIISYSAKNGFCKFTQLILNIMDKHENEHDAFNKMVFQ